MASREVLLLAFGANKAEAVAAAVEGPITAMNPASVLQMHPSRNASRTSLRRKSCASRILPLVFAHKPDWQRIG